MAPETGPARRRIRGGACSGSRAWTTSRPSAISKSERKADYDTAGKDYFVREFAYGAFQRSFELPEGVDVARVEAKYANGMLKVRVPAPQVTTRKMIEVKAA
jgi:hypothetical protein